MKPKVNIKYNIGYWYRLYYLIINILIVKIMPDRLLCDRFVPEFGFAKIKMPKYSTRGKIRI